MAIGLLSDDWIYSAEIIDLAGPIVNSLSRKCLESKIGTEQSSLQNIFKESRKQLENQEYLI